MNMEQKIRQFVAKHLDKGLDFDGVFGNQCVDVVKAWVAFLGITQRWVAGTAKDIFLHPALVLLRNFDLIPHDQPVKVGDITNWGEALFAEYGHTAVAVADENEEGIRVIEQYGGDTKQDDVCQIRNKPIRNPQSVWSTAYLGALRLKENPNSEAEKNIQHIAEISKPKAPYDRVAEEYEKHTKELPPPPTQVIIDTHRDHEAAALPSTLDEYKQEPIIQQNHDPQAPHTHIQPPARQEEKGMGVIEKTVIDAGQHGLPVAVIVMIAHIIHPDSHLDASTVATMVAIAAPAWSLVLHTIKKHYGQR